MAFIDIRELTGAELVGEGAQKTEFRLRTRNTYEPNYIEDMRVSIIQWRGGFDSLSSVKAGVPVGIPDEDVQRCCIYLTPRDELKNLDVSYVEEHAREIFVDSYDTVRSYEPKYLYIRRGALAVSDVKVKGIYNGEQLSKNFAPDGSEGQLNISFGSDQPGYHGNAFSQDYGFNSVWIASNMPIFVSYDDAEYYVRSGEIRNLWNGDDEIAEVKPSDLFYYYNMKLYRTTSSFSDGQLMKTVNVKIWTNNGKISGYADDSAPANVQLLGSRENITKIEARVDDVPTALSWDTLRDYYLTYTRGNDVLSDGEYYYYANVTKNIYIGVDLDDAQDNIGKKEPLDSVKNRTGDDVEKTDNADIELKSDMTSVYLLNESDLNLVASDLYSNDSTIQNKITEAFTLYNNPIEFIQSLYMLPFDPNAMTTTVNTKVRLGHWDVDTSNAKSVKANKIATLCNVFVNETFGNYLDYTNVRTLLYLPYCGVFDIDYGSIINKVLKIEVILDSVNATMKYYIKADDCLLMTKECNVGRSLTIYGSDIVGKNKEVVNSGINFMTSTISAVTSASMGDYTGLANSVIAATQSGVTAYLGATGQSESKLMLSGASSSGVACLDTPYPMLILDITGAIIPKNLYNLYGVPCNTMAKLSTCKGFTQCADVHLSGSMLPEVRERIETRLRNGVIF